MLFLVYLETLKASAPLTLEADDLLTAVQLSYRERVRRMTTVPMRQSVVLQANRQRLDMWQDLRGALMGTSPREACAVLLLKIYLTPLPLCIYMPLSIYIYHNSNIKRKARALLYRSEIYLPDSNAR